MLSKSNYSILSVDDVISIDDIHFTDFDEPEEIEEAPPDASVKKDIRKKPNKYFLEKIEAIKEYFHVSTEAAVYIYYRRKRSFPWKKKGDIKYLYWNSKLLDSLIQIDSVLDFDWRMMEFGKEEEMFKKYDITPNIDIDFIKTDKPSKYIDEEGNEWTHIPCKKKEQLLVNMGLLPKRRK